MLFLTRADGQRAILAIDGKANWRELPD